MSYLSSKTSNLDPVINYISNGRAYNSTEGWTTYAESDAVTFQNTGDTVTLNSHGLSNGNQISFTAVGTSGLTANLLYYVISATTNTFQVATSLGGSAVAITADSSGTLVRSTPKLGVGGSPSTTFTRNTSSPLRQGADFRFAKDAANRMGQGVAYDFTIDDADLAKVLTISFDYELITATGTYANGDVTVYIIQDPTGTPVVIQPAGYTVLSAASGLPVKEIATFQTSNSVKSYRLCVHVASVSATAYTLAIDNVVVGPQVVQYGAPVTDWQAYTPTTQGFGTPTNVDVYWRRVGGDIQIRGSFTTGTVTAAGARLNFPSGLVSTTDSVADTIIGTFGRGGNTSSHGGFILKQNGAAFVGFGPADTFGSTSNSSLATQLATAVVGSGEKLSFEFFCPISGWSSTVQMSNDTDTRVVAASYSLATTTTFNATTVKFNTKIVDTHNSFDTSTGVYTVPVAGIYRLTFSALSISTGLSVNLRKNGVASVRVEENTTANDSTASCAAIYSCNAGDTLDFFSVSNYSFFGTGSVANTFMTIERLSGPSAIAASETVAARYTIAAAVNSSTTQPINYATKVFDTHGAVTTGASWKFTAPISGLYLVQASGACASSSAAFYIYKNGSFAVDIGSQLSSAALSQNGIIQLNAGDYIDMRYSTSLNTTGTTTQNWMAVTRIGN